MKIYVATGNVHKKNELSAIFAPHTVVIPSDEGITFNPEETGSSFTENSLIKAEALWQIVKQPVLADDSGICVDILDGRPGIFSARYSGGGSGQNAALLAEVAKALGEKPEKAAQVGRSCRFVCAMTLYLEKDKFFVAQETLEGSLVESIERATGAGGFGYDPVFYLEKYGKTVAELGAEEKNAVSHRAKAAAAIRRFLEDLDR